MKTLKGETYKSRILLDYLQNLSSIRTSCAQVFERAENNELLYFEYHADKLEILADYVVPIIIKEYPTLEVPIHSRLRHFETAGVDRLKILNNKVKTDEFVKSALELIIVSILLDAGAGSAWRYMDHISDSTLSKSEGLAVASFNLFMQGLFSSDPDNLYQADAKGLQNISEHIFSIGLQVADKNPLLGLSGRLGLLQQLGVCVEQHPEYFGGDSESPRLGNILEYWLSHVVNDALSMNIIFNSLLDALRDIWPGRYIIDDVNLGDVWPYKLNQTEINPRGFIPFHKLTQWLCYSIIEPLGYLGIQVVDTELLTSLPEYRNGGLLIDLQVLTPKNKDILLMEHAVGSEVIVEWRAMTVAIFDKLLPIIRDKLNLASEDFNLGQMLQGGTWLAGRTIAQKLRADGGPPLKIKSDGTVF